MTRDPRAQLRVIEHQYELIDMVGPQTRAAGLIERIENRCRPSPTRRRVANCGSSGRCPIIGRGSQRWPRPSSRRSPFAPALDRGGSPGRARR